MKEGSSYTNILHMMRKQGYNKDINVIVAEVITANPLEINMGKYTITEDDLYMTETVNNIISGDVGDSSTLYNTTILQPGDKLLVLINESDFFVLDRVV